MSEEGALLSTTERSSLVSHFGQDEGSVVSGQLGRHSLRGDLEGDTDVEVLEDVVSSSVVSGPSGPAPESTYTGEDQASTLVDSEDTSKPVSRKTRRVSSIYELTDDEVAELTPKQLMALNMGEEIDFGDDTLMVKPSDIAISRETKFLSVKEKVASAVKEIGKGGHQLSFLDQLSHDAKVTKVKRRMSVKPGADFVDCGYEPDELKAALRAIMSSNNKYKDNIVKKADGSALKIRVWGPDGITEIGGERVAKKRTKPPPARAVAANSMASIASLDPSVDMSVEGAQTTQELSQLDSERKQLASQGSMGKRSTDGFLPSIRHVSGAMQSVLTLARRTKKKKPLAEVNSPEKNDRHVVSNQRRYSTVQGVLGNLKRGMSKKTSRDVVTLREIEREPTHFSNHSGGSGGMVEERSLNSRESQRSRKADLRKSSLLRRTSRLSAGTESSDVLGALPSPKKKSKNRSLASNSQASVGGRSMGRRSVGFRGSMTSLGSKVKEDPKDIALRLLHEGIRDGNVLGVEQQLNFGFKDLGLDSNAVTDLVDQTDESGRTALMVAIHSGQEEMVELLLRQGCNTEAKDQPLERTPLHVAAHAGLEKVVEMLLGSNAEILATDKIGRTCFHFAFSSPADSAINTVMLLLRHEPNLINRTDIHGDKPLLYAERCGSINQLITAAAKTGDIDAINALRKIGADIGQVTGGDGGTALHYAVRNGRRSCATRLIEEIGLDHIVNNKDKKGNTALHYAALYGDELLVKLLLHRGKADIEAKNSERRTPLHMAVHGAFLAVVEFLVGAGAKIEVTDVNRWTPLLTAIRAYDVCTLEIAKFLIRSNANVDAFDIEGRTALHLAINAGCDFFVDPLIEGGASMESVDSRGWTPLFYGVESDNIRVIKKLLIAGSDANVIDQDGNTLFHVAVSSNSVKTCAAFASAKKQLDIFNANGNCPLHEAAKLGHTMILQCAISYADIDLHFKNKRNLGFAILARYNKRKDTVGFLARVRFKLFVQVAYLKKIHCKEASRMLGAVVGRDLMKDVKKLKKTPLQAWNREGMVRMWFQHVILVKKHYEIREANLQEIASKNR